MMYLLSNGSVAIGGWNAEEEAVPVVIDIISDHADCFFACAGTGKVKAISGVINGITINKGPAGMKAVNTALR